MASSSISQNIEFQPKLSRAEVFELIEHAAKYLRRIQRTTMHEAGLTPPQYHVLQTLWRQDRRALKDLADACNCTPATITGLIDGLEEKGLIRRVANPEDRRSLLAELTPAGQEIREQSSSLEAVYSECCEGLAPHEFHQLGNLLSRLNDSLAHPDPNERRVL